jgi:hypothetical protein
MARTRSFHLKDSFVVRSLGLEFSYELNQVLPLERLIGGGVAINQPQVVREKAPEN